MTNLQKWEYYLKDLESPNHYIRWNWFYAISSALARKVWLDDSKIYPNMYLIFVGPPAVGKSLPADKAVEMLADLVEDNNGKVESVVNISPDSVTLESLFQQLSAASRTIRMPDGTAYSHASMSFCLAEELAVLFRDKSNDLVQFLTQGYACGNFKRTTKHQGNDSIRNMCINLLGCCTPDWIRDNVSSGMIAQGFTSRVIFLYGERARHRIHEIKFNHDQLAKLNELKHYIRQVAKATPGQLKITPEADEWRKNWVATKMDKPFNSDKRLEYYNSRRKIHLYKLAIVKHYSEKLDNTLTVDDFISADRELLLIEPEMHKALASSGTNPLNAIAEAIKTSLRLRGPQAARKILIDHYHMGDEEEQAKAINYLISTSQITSTNEDGIFKYHPVNEDSSD